MMIEKQGAHNEPSHSRHAVRKRASLAPDVYPRGQSQCSHLHSCPRFAQSCRRLERPADLRRLGHQPQYLHSCARDVPGRRTGGRAARQAAAAPQPRLDGWTGGPSDRHRLQSCAHRPRPLDRSLVGRKSRRIGLRRVHLAGNHSPVTQKNELKPWQHEQWCIPAVGAEFVAPMEDVLDLYEEEYDPRYPTVCFDEKLVAPEADVRPAEPMEPGQAARVDYEYERLGTANLFFFVEPLSGWRRVESMQDLRQRIAILEAERNAQRSTISWRFTSNDARDKLHDLYPVVNNQLD